jgi:hypothetical protein
MGKDNLKFNIAYTICKYFKFFMEALSVCVVHYDNDNEFVNQKMGMVIHAEGVEGGKELNTRITAGKDPENRPSRERDGG